MRATWIFFALAAATLIFVMVLRPGPDSSSERAAAVTEPEKPGPARRDAAPEPTADERRRRAGSGDDGRDQDTVIEPQSEKERPSGGYDAIGLAYHRSDDYHAFVEEALDEAADNPAARYYIAKILSECQLAVNQFDGEYPDDYTLSTAIPDDLNPGVNDLMQQQVARCKGFFDDDMRLYGEAEEWMAQAAGDGYGPAVMEQGVRQFRMAQAGRESDFDPAQVVDVLRQRNPDALAHASEMAAVAGASRADESAWLLLACEYGRDCSGDAEWVQALCLQQGCPPDYDNAEDALSLLLSPGEMDQARDRMAELEAALDAGDFDSLFR